MARELPSSEVLDALLGQKLGAVGLVTDMGNRDLRGIRRRAPGFQLFGPGSVVSHGYGGIIDSIVTVSVCGLTVQPLANCCTDTPGDVRAQHLGETAGPPKPQALP